MVKKAFSIVISAFMVFMCTMAAVFVTASAENETGEITLCCKTDELSIDGMTWYLYKVGFRTEDDYVFDGDFAKYPVTLGERSQSTNEWDAETLADAAESLRRYAIADKIPYIAEGITDLNGNVTFSNLENGLYLAVGKELYKNGMFFTSTASFIEVNSAVEENITAYPKISIQMILPNTSLEEAERFTVKKVWRNNSDQPVDRSVVIKADIYCDNEFYESIELSEKNNWKYQWITEEFHEWFVVEREIPDDYTVAYKSNETQYLIVNTLIKTSNDINKQTTTTLTDNTTVTTTHTTATTVTTTTISKLPQTGQLWWPVPLMALSGLVLIGIGFRLSKRNG